MEENGSRKSKKMVPSSQFSLIKIWPFFKNLSPLMFSIKGNETV